MRESTVGLMRAGIILPIFPQIQPYDRGRVPDACDAFGALSRL
jgi:hypothetical protein